MDKNKKIGFIGQGYIGKNYADDFEKRGYSVVRYALEEPHISNKEKIAECDIVFIAVPTPTTPEGFDDHIVDEAINLVGAGKIAVIKSTVLPGTTEKLQRAHSGVLVLNSPEFLSEATAAHDAAHPAQNIIGIPEDTAGHREAAELVLSILPETQSSLVCKSAESELFKYAHNMSGYVQIVLFNIIYDLAQKLGCDWEPIQKAIEADPLISNRYARPIHKSGRGAGGHCFIKDFEAFSSLYHSKIADPLGDKVMAALREKNIDLLKKSGKDLDLLKGVYGN
ncbi:MAG: hypothetical protein WC835_00255 [Candidatus Paceibacterota bacterium]|jgi:nucleotide sugar dehydrogenase